MSKEDKFIIYCMERYRFHKKIGSVLNFVGFWISYISSSAGIEDFQEEVVIVWVSIALAPDRLDHVVCPFNLPG